MKNILTVSVFVVELALFPCSLLSQVPVTWEPSTVSATLLQGTKDVATATLLSKQDLQNIDIRVSGRIRAFVSVSPLHLDTIPKNTPIPLVLTFSAAENAAANSYRGKVHVRP